MSEESGQQRYCRNCGSEIRSGMSFCVSCGTPVTPVAGDPGPTNPGPTPSDGPSPFDNLLISLRQATDRLRGTLSGLGTDGIGGLPRRALGWFRDLSGVPKLVLVGLVALVLLVVLSPVAMVVAGVLLVVSIIALAIRIYQKGPIRNWGMVAVASVVLMFAFGGISGALYGVGFGGSSDSDSGQSSGAPEGSDPSEGEAIDLGGIFHSSDSVPYYEVTTQSSSTVGPGATQLLLQVRMESDLQNQLSGGYEEDLNKVVSDIVTQVPDDYDCAMINVLPSVGPPANAYVSFTALGESANGVPPGQVDIRLHNEP